MAKLKKYLEEAAFHGNLGFVEMVQLYDKATPEQLKELDKIIKANDWEGYKKLVKKVLGVMLF